MIAEARAAQGKPFAVLSNPAVDLSKDYGPPHSGPLFHEMMESVDELLDRKGIKLQNLVKGGWACVYGPGKNYNELPWLRRRFSNFDRVLSVEAQGDCVGNIAAEYMPTLPESEQRKHVLIHGNAEDLRWAIPDQSISFGLFYHLFDTLILGDANRRAIGSEAARVLKPDGIMLAVDIGTPRVEEIMNEEGVHTLCPGRRIFLGSPNLKLE